ncbi:MAG: hypothetical protein LBT26_01225 [Clostridiales Family XIII bacterium]|nr:hypothetical protein [Clostridiales Family XIII bacterium]
MDETAVEAFRGLWKEKSANNRIGNLSAEQLLKDAGAIDENGVTYAALILFGAKNALRKHLPHSEVIFEYRSSEAAGPAAQREEFMMGYFAFYDRIWELINLRNDKQHYQEGMVIYDIPTFKPLNDNLRLRLKRLVEMGIIEHSGRNKYVLARGLYEATGKSGVHTWLIGLDRETNKELLLKHIRANGDKGAPLKELEQVLPGHSKNQIKVLIRELQKSRLIYAVGKTSAARWFAR